MIREAAMTQSVTHIRLTTSQFVWLIPIGIILWFAAAMLLHVLAPMGLLEGGARFAVYAAIIPATLPFVLATKRLVGLRKDQIVAGITIVTATALLCDAFAVGLVPQIYADTPDLVRNAAACVFWGAGVGLFLALWLEHKGERQ
jgi:hypothetical protein